MDKVEFRRREHPARRASAGVGHARCEMPAIEQSMDHLLDLMNWKLPFDKGTGRIRRGRGIAIGFKGITAPTTSVAIVNLYGDGSCALYIGTVDMGQGSDTVMAQIAAEVLNIDGRRHQGNSSRHRRDRLTTWGPSARARRSTWERPCGSPPRTQRRKSPGSRPNSGCRDGANVPLAELLRRKYGHAGRQYHRHGAASSPITRSRITKPGRRRKARRSGVSASRARRSRSTPRPVT